MSKRKYTDLHKDAVVEHPKYGQGRVLSTFKEWEFGQPLVQYDDGQQIWSNPERLSTED